MKYSPPRHTHAASTGSGPLNDCAPGTAAGQPSPSGRAASAAIRVGLTVVSLAVSHALFAESAQPGSTITLEPMTVVGQTGVSRAEALRQGFANAPGATAVVGAEDIAGIPAPNFADAMIGVPGVVIQEFFGGNDQPRFQIRGSGLQQSPTERGLLVLQNGMPVNRADGSYVAGLAAPGLAEAIEVWRGPSAHRLGASVLGGAVNFISPTGSSAPGSAISFGGGSFGQRSVSAQTSFLGDDIDGLVQFEWDSADGYRDENNDSRRGVLAGNLEIAHGDGVATQLFLSYTDLKFEVPGPITKDALKRDPESVHAGPTIVMGSPINPGPNVPRDEPRRATTQVLAGGRTTIDRTQHVYDVGVSVSQTDDSFRFPIPSSERVTDGIDGTLSARYAYLPDYVAGLPMLEATLLYAVGEADRENYHNTNGKRGPQFGKSDLSSYTLSPYLGFNIPLSDQWYLSPSVSYTWASRENDDRWTDSTRPTVGYNPVTGARLPDGTVPAQDTSYDRDFDGWSGALALTWKPVPTQTAWVSIAHSFEPPTHDDLIAPVNGTPNSGPGRPNPPVPTSTAAMFTTPDLKAQTSDTLEIGWRGTHRGIGWDVTAYHSWIDDEILSLRDESAAPRASINADETLHTGVELGLSSELTRSLSGRLAWTWQDFRFDDDPVRGDNQLGGSPSHVISGYLTWAPIQSVTLLGTVRWVPDKTPVDNMNTLYADPYTVVDLRADWAVTKDFSVVAEATNVFDETYAASTLVVDQARPDQAAFIAGEGRGFYLGGRMTF